MNNGRKQRTMAAYSSSNVTPWCYQCQNILDKSHLEQLGFNGLLFNNNDHDKSVHQSCPFCVACQHDISSVFAYGASQLNGIDSVEDIRKIRVRKRSGHSSMFYVVKSSYTHDQDINDRYGPSSTEIQQARSWFHECQNRQNEHSNCPVFAEVPLPTRVIKVGNHNDESVRLESQNGTEGQYIALSYCWGGPQATITTKDSLVRHEQEILISTLPRTLKDAIFVTRYLGLPNLWIDALCIIQDDDVDKARELNKMGSIYRNATLVLAAGNTSGVNKGFLRKPDPPSIIYLPYTNADGNIAHLSLTGTVEYWEEEEDPLFARAWCFQEMLLASRALTYGKHGLNWRCNAKTIIREPPWVFYAGTLHSLSYAINESIPPLLLWSAIVGQYSKRSATYSEDRLPALAGVAAEVHRIWKYKYVAGLWEELLPLQLAWRTYPAEVPSDSHNRIGGPSWSWASLSGSIGIEDTDDKVSLIEVIRTEIKLRMTIALFGQVESGILTVRGLVCNAVGISTSDGAIWEYFLDLPWIEKPDSVDSVQTLGTHQLPTKLVKGISFLLVTKNVNRSDYSGIIIIPENETQFRRIGMFEVKSTSGPLVMGVEENHKRLSNVEWRPTELLDGWSTRIINVV